MTNRVRSIQTGYLLHSLVPNYKMALSIERKDAFDGGVEDLR
jgi:hypothetical protein